MEADAPLDSSRFMIENAQRHIGYLEREIRAFNDRHPYAHVIDQDADGLTDRHKVRLTEPLPRSLKGMAFDAANNLRAALDQAGYAVARAAGNKGRAAHFPFGLTRREAYGRRTKQSKDIPQEVFDVMMALEPYQGGKGLLWPLNVMCNTPKHEIIFPVLAGVGGEYIKELVVNGASVREMRAPGPTWDAAKNEVEFLVVAHSAQVRYNLTIALGVVLGQVEGVTGQSALAVLNAMLREVQGGVMAIEAEARRIGLPV